MHGVFETAKMIFNWLRIHEYIAIWLEGIALVAIFWLDLKERKDNGKENERQHQETLDQLRISRKQTEASTEAALATKRSADILAALHRPFIGLSHVMVKEGWGTQFWNIAFGIKNYGTLPAFRVGFMVTVFSDDIRRVQYTRPTTFQIMPSSEFEAILAVNWGELDSPAIHNETMKVRIEVQISYHTEDGRSFEFTSEVLFKDRSFSTETSSTKLMPDTR